MRLLHPEDYGLFGMAIVFVTAAQVIAEFGIGSTIVAMQKLSKEDESQLHSVSTLFGFSAFIVALAAAYPISQFFREPRVVALVFALGVPLFINSVMTVPLALATKKLDYPTMAISDLLRTLMGAFISLAFAFAGAGVWALVIAQIAAAISATLFLLVRVPTSFSFPQISRIIVPLKYSREILVERIAWMFYSSMPAIIGGRLLGADGLGVYVFAFTIASMPGEKLVNIITSVATPLLARAQSDASQLRSLLAKLVEGIAIVTWPLLVGLALVSSLLIEVVFGERWSNADTSIKILSIYFIIKVVMTPFGQLFLVTGQAKLNRQLSVLAALLLPVAFFLGAQIVGPTGLSLAWWITVPIFLAPSLSLLKRIVGFGPFQFFNVVIRTALCVAVMAGAVTLSMYIFNSSARFQLVSAIIVGAIVYMSAIFFVKRSAILRLLSEYRKANVKDA